MNVTRLQTNANENNDTKQVIPNDFIAMYKKRRVTKPQETRDQAIRLTLFEMEPKFKKVRFTMRFKQLCDTADMMLKQEGVSL